MLNGRGSRALDSFLFGKCASRVLGSILLTSFLVLFAPFSYQLPEPGLDPSWALGMNQAVAQKLAFGKDVIFTFGPYASVFTREYHPATDLRGLCAGVFLGVSYFMGLWFLARRSRRLWPLSLFVVLPGAVFARDALLFSFPLLAVLVLGVSPAQERAEEPTAPPLSLVVLLLGSLGLLPLIKATLLISCVGAVALSAMGRAMEGRRLSAASFLMIPALAMALWWAAAGQRVQDLPGFLRAVGDVVSGYGEAMALPGPASEIYLYLLSSSLFVLHVCFARQRRRSQKVVVALAVGLFLFLGFKGGFVRHDGPHKLIAAASLFLLSILSPFLADSRAVLPAAVLGIVVSLSVAGHYTDATLPSLLARSTAVYAEAATGLLARLSSHGRLQQDFRAALARVSAEARWPRLPGRVDTYPFDQAYLIASGGVWSPRPVMQSYCAYTPMLAEKNREHLVGAKAPDFVFFRVQPIDARLPALEDGASWPNLLTLYRPFGIVNGDILLRRSAALGTTSRVSPITEERCAFGTWVRVPRGPGPVFARLQFDQTAFGKLADFVFKVPILAIWLSTEDGTERCYWLPPRMAKAGFVLSPLVEDTEEFRLLYGAGDSLARKRVRAFLIDCEPGGTNYWKREYRAAFEHFEHEPSTR